jgi:hypothetical protein
MDDYGNEREKKGEKEEGEYLLIIEFKGKTESGSENGTYFQFITTSLGISLFHHRNRRDRHRYTILPNIQQTTAMLDI